MCAVKMPPKTSSAAAVSVSVPPVRRNKAEKWRGDTLRTCKLIHDASSAYQQGRLSDGDIDELRALHAFVTHAHAASLGAMTTLQELEE